MGVEFNKATKESEAEDGINECQKAKRKKCIY